VKLPPFSKKWRENIGKSKKGVKLPPFSEEHKRKIGIASKNRIVSEKTKLKISKSHKGILPWNTGKSHPKKVREKISKSLYGRFRGVKSPNWKGGKKIIKGYISVYAKNHPFAHKSGDVYEHRLVMEKKIGRYLKPEEVVHHIDRNTFNNHPSNLQLFANQSEHSKLPR